MPLLDYWIIKIAVNEQKSSVLVQQVREELYVSSHVRLSGMMKMAHLESQELAEDFLKACRPVFDKRYPCGYEAWLVQASGSDHRSLRQLIAKDSDVVRERLRSGNMAPNKKPSVNNSPIK